MKNKECTEVSFEKVNCFRCGIKGHLLYKQGPFGVNKCSQCGQVFISPRLKEIARKRMYENSGYFDEGIYGFSKKFSLALIPQKIWSYSRLNLIRHLLKGKIKGKKLLEIGCAYGLFLEISRQKGFEVTGIEYSYTAVKWIRKNLGLNVYYGEIEKIRLQENDYDIICFWDVIEHVEDPGLFLKSVSRVIKENGFIIFSCPYFNSLLASIFKSKWWTLKPEQHLWHFTLNTLDMVFSDSKLQLIRVIRSPFSLVNFSRFDSIVGIAKKSKRIKG